MQPASRFVRVTSLPVSIDVEAGYGDSPDEVGDNVRTLIEAGAIGINQEDGIRHQELRDSSSRKSWSDNN